MAFIRKIREALAKERAVLAHNIQGQAPVARRSRGGRFQPSSPASRPSARPGGRLLAAGEYLFDAGDARDQLYRVEAGALCHYISWEDGRHEVIEFAFPGDILGFGFLDRHVSAAQAVSRARVSVVARDAFNQALATDAQLALRVAVTADREFDAVRARAVKSAPRSAVEKTGAYLVAIAGLVGGNSPDACIVPAHDLDHWAAERLGLGAAEFDAALAELESMGLLTRRDVGAVIPDLGALERAIAA